LRDDEQAAAVDGVAERFLRGIVVHDVRLHRLVSIAIGTDL